MATELASSSENLVQLTKKDFESDQDVRWCPGCGDYSVLAAVQRLLPKLDIPIEKYVFVSGIGCSSRFPYYMNTYGFHTIHGRAPAIASGVKITNPDLAVWLVTGDGDALSIGGNHILHLLRRNLNINVLLFNNRIYGLTKGQYSPTSEVGKKTGSTPFGSTDHPINPLLVALSAEATFVARTLDADPKSMANVFEEASQHEGTSFVEIFQNCNIFNDGAWEYVSDKKNRDETQVQLSDGELLIFGKEKDKGLRWNERYELEVVEFEAGSTDAAREAGVLTHDRSNSQLATALARLQFPDQPTPMGVLYQTSRPCFEQLVHEQEAFAKEKKPINGSADANLSGLFGSGDTWDVS